MEACCLSPLIEVFKLVLSKKDELETWYVKLEKFVTFVLSLIGGNE